MKLEDDITQEEFDRLTEDCRVIEVPIYSFERVKRESTKEFISILVEFSDVIFHGNGKAVTVCRLVDGLNSPLIQDWLEKLGEPNISGRSHSKVEVRIFDGILAVSNTTRAKDCTRRQHNQNIMFNIEHILEDNYLKEKQYEQR